MKNLAMALLAIFIISIVASVPINTVSAQASMKTYAISDAIPDVLGLGEETLLKCGISEALASADLGWEGVTITVEDPDGVTTELGPFRTDSTGSTYTLYTPTKIGTYTITTHFPEQEMPVTTFTMERGTVILAGTIMEASEKTSTFLVTEELSQQYPGHPLPTEYWSRPVDPQLREWFSVTGNWVARPDNSIALYNDDAPETAHALWAVDYTTGGLAGGLLGYGIPAASETGDAYEGKYSNSVILNGVLYYNHHDQGLPDSLVAVDLHTGETLWTKENCSVTFGQVLYFNSYNYDGVFTYLWSVSGSTYTAYDPFDGRYVWSMTNVPSGTRTFGPSGEILIYVMNVNTGRLMLWNSTECGLQNSAVGTPNRGSWGSQVQGRVMDGSAAASYTFNVSIPSGLRQSNSFFSPIVKIYNEDRIVSMFFNQTQVNVWAININGLDQTSTSASLIFNKWWNAPSEWLDGANTLHYVGATNYVTDDTYGDGVIGIWSKEITTHYGFSVVDGSYLWSTESEDYLDMYGWGNAEHTWYYAYGNLYSVGVGGILYAYDLSTGTTIWTYNMTDPYGEPVTGQNWWGWIDLIADGKIYFGTLEHSAENPLPRGAPYICVNATDGTEIFRVNGMYRETRWGGNGIIGDSIIATMDTYDQRVYAIGKGPSQTTVVSPTSSIVDGQSMIIQGSVTDISPGLSDYSIAARFPNGVPAVSDESMSAWMLYVWKQFECPSNVIGVPVEVSVIDANGNYRTIGTTTTDATGHYSLAWLPDIPGAYQVYVTFAGTAGYYGSVASTTYVVDEAAATATPQPTQAPSTADQYFIPAVAIIAVLIVIFGVLTILMMRKRP